MLRKLSQIVIWKYADDVPIDKLNRHHRIARRIVYVWVVSSILMASSIVEILLTRGTWAMILCLCAAGVAMLSSIPGILSIAWAGEIEKTLAARGSAIPEAMPVGKRLPGFAMKMCYWFVAAILVAAWLDRRR